MSTSVDIRKTVRGPVPRIPFEEIAKNVLGAQYELSLVICGDELARRINRENRKKTYAPNVLSFPLGKLEGEIFLNIRKAEREAREYRTTLRARLALLFVHGLYHLKGLDHGARMERLEHTTLKRFRFSK
ncbi:rRNA maturation RNase YbeY [Candidatus Kaiserbacteria bacterium RIFCSPHIGHO2_02_FULL_55_25]|uniref:Endoribonuclease YbeY n=1 Tax=Candidatus Kaiserbacteria bacterium RIFCSPHIGHO2_02_FULL_55_25 TaxID=1798498 RepID=A0A1F6E6J3_9BACT|nr:MAG: rRNA maturation RNase YbeY [Candidatus Kaiserbacteria bacterium RIFCSPHIGHO2_01_FULL_55_79]OGG69160.1 MAG: rRNA maturation RNase YbeY [Candidatus Kaiserbacteria bacterium RIFCSPHIGHO2_02_FULL_55_25]OGG77192.1 MAG: rRNA maturation RNase YbeY [Candidatus Kaiserbacteria bacterium RIFCSPHIGHO2_12_FULL_55_13]OGG83337.1 MAG: rRNA maturation RNase YbeY [Candidatus Kaiserbacteria bacterium RIFCSPLOWO2_01_FULL_55_25]